MFEESFEKIADYNSTIQQRNYDVLKECVGSRKLFIYGSGLGSKPIVTSLQTSRIPISGVCDSHKKGIFPLTGDVIISPQELQENNPDALVLITSLKFQSEIYASLRSLGFPSEQILFFPGVAGSLITVDEFVETHYEGYKFAYDALSDGVSKKTLIGMMNAFISGVPQMPVDYFPEYFEKGIFKLYQNEVFVDAGVMYGETIEMFILQCMKAGVKYKKIYGFEPHPKNFNMAIEELENFSDIELVPKGLWSHETELVFNLRDASGSSFQQERGSGDTLTVSTTSLDEYFARINDLPTFIKMDIEGAEQEALQGAKNVIVSNRPKLAIAAYHKIDDVYEFIKIIREFCPEYRFELRKHGTGVAGHCIYAYI